MAAIAALPFLSACASNGTGRYLLITETHHGPIIWHRFKTQEACEDASRGSDPTFATRCTTAEAQRGN